MKKSLLVILSLTFIAICLLVTRSIISNRISTSGELLSQINEKTNKYRMENAIIGEELYDVLSYTKLSEKATKLGFVEQKGALSLARSVPLALKQ